MPATPYLALDLAILEANIARMAQRGRDAGLAIRPHVKTHKMPEIAQMQMDAGACGITVATVGEAEVFADAGFDDIFIAYPLWVDDELGARLAALTQKARVLVGADSIESARVMRANTGGAPLEVLIEVDSGQHRSGVAPHEAGELACGIMNVGFDVRGVFTFPGHSYAPQARATAATDEHDALTRASASLISRGVEPVIRSGGSSPSMAYVNMPAAEFGPTEMRPGAYVFNDAQQWELGVVTASDIALTAHARVVSHAGGRLILNSGSKTLAPDRAPWASGAGRLLDYPEARIVQLSEHHAVAEMNGSELPRIGSVVRVVPNHCCNAINNADSVILVRSDEEIGAWRIAARGMNA